MKYFAMLITACWFSLTFVSASLAADTEDYALQFEQAQQATTAGQTERAVTLWQQLLKTYPNDLAASNNLAVALMQQKQFVAAQQQLEAILKADPKYAVVLKNLDALYAFQAQQAYQKVFKNTQLNLPIGQSIIATDSTTLQSQQANAALAKRHAEQVLMSIESWRTAWSAQQVDAYLSFYEPNYVPANFTRHQTWVASRKASLKRPNFIRVQLNDINIVPLADDTLQVVFQQRYESNRFKDAVQKRMIWRKVNDTNLSTENSNVEWRIVQEQVIYE